VSLMGMEKYMMRMQVMAVADRIAQMRRSFSHSCLVLGNFRSIGELILTSLRGCFDTRLQRQNPLVQISNHFQGNSLTF
jgi:hypothetical protein